MNNDSYDHLNHETPADHNLPGSLGGWGVFEVLIKNRRAIIWYPLVIAVAVALFSLIVPPQYIGEVTVLPPDRDFQSLSLVSLTAGDFGMAGGLSLPLMATPSDILAQILESRRVLRAVVDSLRLDSLWAMPSVYSTVRRLAKAVTVQVELTGLVRVRVIDRDLHLAVRMANMLVACADAINRSMVNTKARLKREFIETRLTETREALKAAGADLEVFQREHKTVALDDELRVLIQNAASLKAQLTMDEIELSVLKTNMSSQNPRVAALETRVAEIRRRLTAMESGADSGQTFLSTGLQEAPRLILDLAEKTRRVKIEESMLELLSSQYESAKIQEAQDMPTISVLDFAEPDWRRFRPRRVRLVVAAYVASLAVMIGLSFAGEYFAVMRRHQPEKYQRLRDGLDVLRRDALGLKGQTKRK